MQEQDLKQRLYEDLQDTCYLVVLDDVWKEEAWDCLSRAFPDVSTSSRLLLTSSNRDVALHAEALSIPYELKTFGQEDRWQLFLRKALGPGADGGCPLYLEEVGRDIVRISAGLPLAIAVTGGLLPGKKKLKSEWEYVLNNFSTYLSRRKSEAWAILEFYADLPPNLIFGLLGNNAENLEKTAAYDVEQLTSRNMVQVAEMTFDDWIRSCRLHDLFRELAIRKLSHLQGKVNLSFKSSRKLKVADLENVNINRLPKEIGEVRLLILRYLGLRETLIEKLPHSLCCLQNLHTLDIVNLDSEVEVSDFVWKLESLRHRFSL
nr:putative disease resistance protein At1g50180 [Coffea arabica]